MLTSGSIILSVKVCEGCEPAGHWHYFTNTNNILKCSSGNNQYSMAKLNSINQNRIRNNV